LPGKRHNSSANSIALIESGADMRFKRFRNDPRIIRKINQTEEANVQSFHIAKFFSAFHTACTSVSLIALFRDGGSFQDWITKEFWEDMLMLTSAGTDDKIFTERPLENQARSILAMTNASRMIVTMTLM
jgi:hypothetical protein